MFCGISVIEGKKKLTVNILKECGLTISRECNLKTITFLDITFDLQNNVYKSYGKANDNPNYIGRSIENSKCQKHNQTRPYLKDP